MTRLALLFSALLTLACGNDPDDAPTDDADAPDGAVPTPAACVAPSIGHYRVRFEGTGLDAHEGLTAHVLTAMQLTSSAQTCSVRGSALIEDGAFEIELTNSTDGGVYPLDSVFIDLDGDGKCSSEADIGWSTYGSVPVGALEVQSLAASDFSSSNTRPACEGF
jgi:hypothetical protein